MFSLELSDLAALVDRFGLPRHWAPFDVPHVDVTAEDRKRRTAQVWAKLQTAGLVHRDRLSADTENAMLTWTRPDVLLVVRAYQTVEQSLVMYRAVTGRGTGVVSELVGERIDFHLMRAGQLIDTMVGQLPQWAPVPLREVSVISGEAGSPEEAPDEEYYDNPLGFRDGPLAGSRRADLRAMREFGFWPIERFGSFELSIRGPGDRMEPRGIVQFVDTDGGRFLVFTTTLGGDQRRLSFVPSDGSHLRHWLHEQVAHAKKKQARVHRRR